MEEGSKIVPGKLEYAEYERNLGSKLLRGLKE